MNFYVLFLENGMQGIGKKKIKTLLEDTNMG